MFKIRKYEGDWGCFPWSGTYLVLLLLLTDLVAVTAVADLFLVAAVSDFADAETEDEVVSVATAEFPDSKPENHMMGYLAMSKAEPDQFFHKTCCGGKNLASLNSRSAAWLQSRKSPRRWEKTQVAASCIKASLTPAQREFSKPKSILRFWLINSPIQLPKLIVDGSHFIQCDIWCSYNDDSMGARTRQLWSVIYVQLGRVGCKILPICCANRFLSERCRAVCLRTNSETPTQSRWRMQKKSFLWRFARISFALTLWTFRPAVHVVCTKSRKKSQGGDLSFRLTCINAVFTIFGAMAFLAYLQATTPPQTKFVECLRLQPLPYWANVPNRQLCRSLHRSSALTGTRVAAASALW